MPENPAIDRKHAAGLVMDYMVGVVAGFVGEPATFRRCRGLLERLRRLVHLLSENGVSTLCRNIVELAPEGTREPRRRNASSGPPQTAVLAAGVEPGPHTPARRRGIRRRGSSPPPKPREVQPSSVNVATLATSAGASLPLPPCPPAARWERVEA